MGKQTWIIVDWAGNRIDTGGETFDSFEDGWSWICEFVEDEQDHEDLYVICENDYEQTK